ncbi:Alpha/beta-hydrolase [Fusarium sp. LHS14.1]|nr:Alpha/beta-hydrolase [Fusarium sp. LHS14.1]
MSSPTSTGIFFDLQGLSYRSGDCEGIIGPDGKFEYIPGHEVAFSIGPLQLGLTKGKPRMTVLDLVDSPSLDNPRLINRARLLFTLAPGLGFEKPVMVDDNVRAVISKHAPQIDLDVQDPSDLDTALKHVARELGLLLKTITHVRNHLRRALAGFRVLRDIQVPVRDGNYVLADIYLPPEGRFPTLVSSTVYGKRVVFSGPRLDDADEIAKFEEAEEIFFSTSDNSPITIPNTGGYFGSWTKQRGYETISTFNTFFWVPRGYAMVKIDPRGVGQTPGRRGVLVSDQEANDIFDVVEWTAKQPWSTGDVALSGNSYGANCQWQTVARKPKGLKAFIPYGTEVDLYRDLSFIGGVPTFKFLDLWTTGIRVSSPRWPDSEDIVQTFSKHLFFDDYWEKVQVPLESIRTPVFLGAAQMLIFHHRGPYEAWRRIGSRYKYLEIVDTNYYSWPNCEAVYKLFLFAERHLRGVDHREELEPVGMQMRIGYGDWYWRAESAWEIPGTKYVDWHLSADRTITTESPNTDKGVQTMSYAADTEPKSDKTGISFLSNPFEEDVELAGHFTATLSISSSSYDADVVVSLWAIDENEEVVKFCVGPNKEPFASGLLRASRRKTDTAKSLPWRPWHTHTEEDCAPLKDGEVVEVNIEICPATARIRAGWRLRVDILPTEAQPDIVGYQAPAARSWIEEYHQGEVNTLHIGGGFKNFIRLPTVPIKEIGALNVVI